MAFASAKVSRATTTEPRARIRRLALTDFRNYAHVDVDVAAGVDGGRGGGRIADRIVLYGANGAGKTNLLEAMSLLGPGRGLRRATLQELDRDGAGPWSVEATVDTTDGPVELFTGRDGESDRRNVRLFDRPLRGRSALAELLTVTWLVPSMDRLLVEGPGARRRFLDRLAAAVQPDHSARVAAYERAMRERSVLLREGGRDPAWLRALEQRMAEPAVAIAAARLDALAELNERLYKPVIDLPSVSLESNGEVEEGSAGRVLWMWNRSFLGCSRRRGDVMRSQEGRRMDRIGPISSCATYRPASRRSGHRPDDKRRCCWRSCWRRRIWCSIGREFRRSSCWTRWRPISTRTGERHCARRSWRVPGRHGSPARIDHFFRRSSSAACFCT